MDSRRRCIERVIIPRSHPSTIQPIRAIRVRRYNDQLSAPSLESLTSEFPNNGPVNVVGSDQVVFLTTIPIQTLRISHRNQVGVKPKTKLATISGTTTLHCVYMLICQQSILSIIGLTVFIAILL